MIYLNSLTDFSSSQTLKLIQYIKRRKFIILVDSGNTHQFLYLCSQQFSGHEVAREVVGGPRGPIVIIVEAIQCKVD
jgi:hypothetical protein